MSNIDLLPVTEALGTLAAERATFTNNLAALVRTKLDPETAHAFDELLARHDQKLEGIASALAAHCDVRFGLAAMAIYFKAQLTDS
jgi:hypothetical protein